MKNTVIFVIGATAIGKTKLGIALAQHFNTSVISCDSRQFFKEMRIGTAVPTAEELDAATHYFIQNKSITEDYNVGDFEKEALQLLDELFEENPIQIVVGGSGLYVDAILTGFDEFPEVSDTIKNEIEIRYQQQGITYLQEELLKYDEKYYEYLKENNPQTLENPQRMMRFVGVSKSSKLPYSSFLNQPKKERNFNAIFVGLTAERAIIYDRINMRVDAMIAQGLVEEVKALQAYKHHNALQTVGYKELFKYLDKEITLEEAIEQIKVNTRRFAKRQETWFKKYQSVLWYDYQTAPEEIIAALETKTEQQKP